MIRADDLTRPNWQCIHFVQASDINVALDELANTELKILRVGVEDVGNERALLACIAEAMRFPDYFGGNWDAFDECLRDMEWLPSKGYVLVVDGSMSLWRSTPHSGGKLVESWLFAAQEWSLEGTPFHLVFVL
jgi:hypothetical protein